MNATGVFWDNGRRGKAKTWTHEIRWPASNPKTTVRVTSARCEMHSHRQAVLILHAFGLNFLTGWVPVDSADHADDGHERALHAHRSAK